MLVRRYGTSYACRLIISIIIRFTPVCLFTLLFVQFIRPRHRYAAIADNQKAWTVRSYDVTRRPVSSCGCRTENLRERMRHEHALLVHAWTRLELSTSSDQCMINMIDDSCGLLW
jgi:hypothetical protein